MGAIGTRRQCFTADKTKVLKSLLDPSFISLLGSFFVIGAVSVMRTELFSELFCNWLGGDLARA